MKFRCALAVAELHADPAQTVSALRCVCGGTLERLVVLARARPPPWWSSEPLVPDAHDDAAIARWRQAGATLGAHLELVTTAEHSLEALDDLALSRQADLLVAAAPTLEATALVRRASLTLSVAALWPGGPAARAAATRVFAFAASDRGRAALLALLNARADAPLQLTVVTALSKPDVAAALQLAGIASTAEVVDGSALTLSSQLAAAARAGKAELAVVAWLPPQLVLFEDRPCPVLLAPPVAAERAAPEVDVADAAGGEATLRTRVQLVTLTGGLAPAPGLALGVIARGRVAARAVTSPAGELELPRLEAEWLGLIPDAGENPGDFVAAVRRRFAVVEPKAQGPLVAVDAALSDEALGAARTGAQALGARLLALRLRPDRTIASTRARLERLDLPSVVLDARAVLDEGHALDVAEANDPVRLGRAAARLRRQGFDVRGYAPKGAASVLPVPDGLPPLEPGNRVEVELDNALARRWLLDLIAGARERLHLQTYMALDGAVGRAVEDELARAAARGVKVRVLIDAVFGRYGALGGGDSLLERLARHRGVELRLARPLTRLPSVTELKVRDHRKVVVADGRRAQLGGRNLADEYYTGFDEARLELKSSWREVPWLDAGARLEGPAVATIERGFRDAWVDAGGQPFDVAVPPSAGRSAVRVVTHLGLRDAQTLEVYRELIDSARSHLYVANAFPFALELQHALVRAVRRGVVVKVLSGHLTPTHDGKPFDGPWSAARATATQFVHSRVDPVLEAGAHVWFFAQRGHPLWAEGLGVVHTHVHAKLVTADGRRCVVGSANLDVTSSYWESDLSLLVEDEAVAAVLEARLEQLLASSTPVVADEAWRLRARQRAWLLRWPGLLTV